MSNKTQTIPLTLGAGQLGFTVVRQIIFPVDSLASAVGNMAFVLTESPSISEHFAVLTELLNQLRSSNDHAVRLGLLRQIRLILAEMDQELAKSTHSLA